jgi:glycogen debranching enzyme
MTDLTVEARAVLRANDRGGYTVPTARLYPFQWNWDAAFVAMGWATFDQGRAWDEIEFLLRGQWEDGMIPQIVFHASSDDYFPGPEVWGVARDPQTSGITQPPVLATAVRKLLEAGRDRNGAEARAAQAYPHLVSSHRWWHRARDPAGTGLVASLHPWETGMDNSPAWDRALDRVPADATTPVRRRDTAYVDASARPRDLDYQRFIHLVDLYRGERWDSDRMWRVSPFRVADVGTNAILLRAEEDLLALAKRFGSVSERAEIDERIARLRHAIDGLWHGKLGLFTSRDLIAGTPIEAGTSAGLLPLWGGIGTAAQIEALVGTLRRWAARGAYLVPSADPEDARFELARYWRGPVWAIVNWVIADGLSRAGRRNWARRILDQTRELIERSGFSEYFDPIAGCPLGGSAFSWTAAIYLLLADARAAG